jgi:hypothetical protein
VTRTVDLDRLDKWRAMLSIFSKWEGECLVWTRSRDADGYGRMRAGGSTMGAHRVAWVVSHGEQVPPGLSVLHSCDNPPCIHPGHVFLGDNLENIRDRDAKGRQARGTRQHSSKLSVEQVVALRERARSGESVVLIGREFGIRPWAAQKIRDGVTWKHV